MPGDVGQHAADEGIHHLERADVDQHAPRAGAGDAVGQVVLQRQGELVVHVHLDRDQEELAHLEDRNAVHGGLDYARGAVTRATPRLSASERHGEGVGQTWPW